MFCRKCGKEIPDNSTVCGYCGTPTDPNNSYFYGGTPQNMDGGANGMAIASMVLGIIAVLLSCCSGTRWLTVIVAVVGIVFGILALQKKEFNNRGMAIAGGYFDTAGSSWNCFFDEPFFRDSWLLMK